ncbi:MAG: hypothetical protein JSS35_02075, partial [Proteobacteria bacterium]|nr:hypothetical protein [Pseudomonadota bacterium]
MTGHFSPDDAQNRLALKPAGPAVRRRAASSLLKFGPALASASALIWAAPALAQSTTTTTTVSSQSTTPLVTSKAGDITVNVGASIKPASPSTPAVTIDSNNSLINNGLLFFQNQNNATAVLAHGGNTGSIENTGTIEVDDNSQTTTDSNGIIHGPFANGSNRIGIQIVGPGVYTADVSNTATGVINIKGDNSYGISLETALSGTLANSGSITASGTNAIGIRSTNAGTISGAVTLGGTIVASGQGAQAVNLAGDINDALDINGTISSTGYRY